MQVKVIASCVYDGWNRHKKGKVYTISKESEISLYGHLPMCNEAKKAFKELARKKGLVDYKFPVDPAVREAKFIPGVKRKANPLDEETSYHGMQNPNEGNTEPAMVTEGQKDDAEREVL